MNDNAAFLLVSAGLVLLMTIGSLLVLLLAFRVWLRAFLSGARVSVIDILGMRLRGNPPGLLVDALLALRHRSVDASLRDVESTYVAHKGMPMSPIELAELVEQRLGN